MALPHGALGWSTNVSMVFPDNTQFVCLLGGGGGGIFGLKIDNKNC